MTIHRDYPCNARNCQKGRALPVSFLVYHYVGATGGAKANARYFHNTAGTGASAHYFVGHESEDAAVWQSVAEEDTAWHCGRTDGRYKHPKCRNANSIGIEMCCHLDASGNWYIDEATLAAAAELGRDIMARHNIPIENVVRHYDVTGKLCPRPLIDESLWAAFKSRLVQASQEETDEEDEDDMTYYATIDDVPVSYQPSVQKLIDLGVLKGYGDNTINVSEDLCRTITILDRIGLLDK